MKLSGFLPLLDQENRHAMRIVKPTLLLNKQRALQNIERMAQKAKKSKVCFRPHFKTHQSAQIGEWFRKFGVEAITVSSLDMAWYFAQYGWKDILVAFPVNILELEKINTIAEYLTLHLLVESPEVVHFLGRYLKQKMNLWIKIDVGDKRTGIPWDNFDAILELVREIKRTKNLTLQGILTHSGHAYAARSKKEIQTIYAETVSRMKAVQDQLDIEGFSGTEISIGDTPCCSVVEDLSDVNEIRPGNFVFYDVMQLAIGSCSEKDLAVAVACPVVAKHAERQELVLYGGAIHLSKEFITKPDEDNGEMKIYGYIALPEQSGWGTIVEHTYVSRLSQEHGIVKADRKLFAQVKIGSMVMVLPVHACLTAHLLRKYMTLEGEMIELASLV
jgi:D-serine deaminase-like pyridoxal phosphate-dependent protein